MAATGHIDEPLADAPATRDDAPTIVWLSGEHDLATADRLTAHLVDEAADSTAVVVDLSGVSFMDASTISAIVRARSQLAEHARMLTVRSPSTLMARVFGICGLDELIEPAAATDVEGPTGAYAALESWVAVEARDREPSGAAPPAIAEAAHETSRE